MRRKRTRIAGVMIAVIVASGMATGTSVYAGTTQSDMAVADSERLENLLSGVSLGNNDVAFGVLNTVAKRDPTIAVDSNTLYYMIVFLHYPCVPKWNMCYPLQVLPMHRYFSNASLLQVVLFQTTLRFAFVSATPYRFPDGHQSAFVRLPSDK